MSYQPNNAANMGGQHVYEDRLVNALAEIERLKAAVDNNVQVSVDYYKQVLELRFSTERKDAALRVALDALKSVKWVTDETEAAITTIKEVLK